MLRFILAVVMLLTAFRPSSAQIVPDNVYSPANGPAEMCGIVGRDAADLLAKARQSADLRAANISSDRFELFEGGNPLRFQLLATLPAEPAFPAVSCREVYEKDGALQMKRTMRCDADRTACDALFLELQDLDAQVTRAMRGGRR